MVPTVPYTCLELASGFIGIIARVTRVPYHTMYVSMYVAEH